MSCSRRYSGDSSFPPPFLSFPVLPFLPSLSCARHLRWRVSFFRYLVFRYFGLFRCSVCASSASASFSPSFSSSISPSLYAGMFVCSFRRIVSGICFFFPSASFFFSAGCYPASSVSIAPLVMRHVLCPLYGILSPYARFPLRPLV